MFSFFLLSPDFPFLLIYWKNEGGAGSSRCVPDLGDTFGL